MSNIVSKIRQRIALRDKNKFDLSCDHYTTADFMQLQPVFIHEMVPGENINVKEQVFTRLAPLIKPMYGRARIELRKFFVPMRTIMRGWNEFITDTTVDGVIPTLPTLNLHRLAHMFRTSSAFATQVAATATVFDFEVITSTSSMASDKYRFTSLGKQVWKILNALGYRFPIGYWAGTLDYTSVKSRVSALPLLAFVKIYSDWFKNQAYNDATFFGLFEGIGSTTLDDENKLISVFQRICKVCYDKDELFISAWDKPSAPNDGLSSVVSIPDITNDNTNDVVTGTAIKQVSSFVSSGYPGHASTPVTPSIKGASSTGATSTISPFNITQYAIDSLKALTDYMKRHQIAGSLAMDRMMARFGMKPSDAALKRSIYLGKNTVDVQIADVMATANGTDAASQTSTVGDYAGKGLGYNDGAVSYSTDEYGYLIYTASVIPSAHYTQGMQPQVFRGVNGRLDFFTPEFDGVGVDAIPRKMLLADYNGPYAESNVNRLTYDALMEGVFGFAPRYASYKTAFDNMTGDFMVPSLFNASNSDVWHLNRIIDPGDTSLSLDNITHNLDFVSGTDSGQYDRVFAVQGEVMNSRFDHFYTIYHFDVESWKPMRKLFDDYDFDGGNKDVTLEVNGTQLN